LFFEASVEADALALYQSRREEERWRLDAVIADREEKLRRRKESIARALQLEAEMRKNDEEASASKNKKKKKRKKR